MINENDTTYITRDYKVNEPMIWQQTFKDANLSIPNGRFAWCDKDGNIDSTGLAINGKKESAWRYFIHIPYKSHGETFIKDSVIKTVYYNLGKRMSKEDYFGDVNENRALKRSFFKTGDPITEEEFNNDTTGRRKAEYPKGPRGWQNYLTYNLNAQLGALIPSYKNFKDNHAPVTISFIVGKDGSTDDIFVLNSAGYPFDNESIRVIKNSGKWIPAQQHGHAVTYRQTQKIVFFHSY